MNKKLIIAFLILTSLSNAQEFAPIGAKWHIITKHGPLTNDVPEIRSNLIQCSDTTWIDGLKWSKVIDSSPAFFGTQEFGIITSTYYLVREDEAGKIFFKHPVTDSTFMLFDKNASIGDVWSYPVDTCFTSSGFYYNGGCEVINNSCRFRVDEIDTVVLNNKMAKRFKLSFSPSINQPYNPFLTTFVYEPFGFQMFTFLLKSFCTADINEKNPLGLRCYEDDYWGLISFTDSVACDSSWLIPISIDKINEIDFELFPNPVNDQLTIRFKTTHNQPTEFIITDLQGRKVLNHSFTSSAFEQNLIISHLSQGAYLIHIQQNGKRIGSKLFVKQ
jgi:hypothetical protein